MKLIEQPPLLYRLLFPEAIWRIKHRGRRVVYLTFDDGPVPEVTPWVLDTLDRYGVHATFFMVGDNVRRHPELLQEVRRRGHSVGNHTMHHLQGMKVTARRYWRDISEADALIGSPLFRPPHGIMRWKQAAAIKRHYNIIMYDLVTRDYSRKLTPERVLDNVRRYARNGSIIVFHDSLKAERNLRAALPKAIEWLLAEGYAFETLPGHMTSAAETHALLDTLCRQAGAVAWGVACVGAVDARDMELYASWLAHGMHGPMDYMERNGALRADPAGLLPGARSIIVCAFSYHQSEHNRWISDYALGEDYHMALRRRLEPVAKEVEAMLGGSTRVCVDSAPLRERYWAEQAGVGRCGLSGKLLVPGAGSEVFLAEILTTAPIAPTPPLAEDLCMSCRRCVEACPAGALDGAGGVDARRCLSCLTVEWRGELPAGTNLHGRLVGCDVCSRACPLSRPSATVPELQPRPAVLAMTPAKALALTRGGFKSVFAGSAIMRLRLSGLRRNATACEEQTGRPQ